MRPIFCGNLEFDARQSEVERLFKRYGKVERVDMKSGVRIGLSTCLQFLWSVIFLSFPLLELLNNCSAFNINVYICVK